MADDKKLPSRKIWGAGYHEGHKVGYAEGYEDGENGRDKPMKQSKIDRIVKNLTSISKKVYDCVPILEEWSKSQIKGELMRVGGNQNSRVVDGCLDGLKKSGLIKEPRVGYFIQITASAPVSIKQQDFTEMSVSQKTNEKPQEAAMCDQVDPVAIIENLTAKMDELKADFEEAAIKISDYVEQSKKSVEKMQQLQMLLKSISD